MTRTFLALGAINALLAVGLGAFGAHVLEEMLTAQDMETYRTAAHYHLTHALGLLAVALAGDRLAGRTGAWAGWLLFAGIVLFSGSLYVLCFTGLRWLGAITPLGGVSFLLGWGTLAYGAYRGKAKDQ